MEEKRVSSGFKIFIFLLGIGIIAGAFFLFNHGRETIPAEKIFMWVNIAVLYLVFFIPFLFIRVKTKSTDGTFMLISAAWPKILIFEAFGILLTIVVPVLGFPIRYGIIIEAVIFLFVFYWIGFGLVAAGHSKEVEEKEEKMMEPIIDLRNASQIDAIKVNQIEDKCASEVARIRELAENIRYLSPVENASAKELESKLFDELSHISEAIDQVINGAGTSELKKHIDNAQILYEQRKAMLN